MTAANCGSLSRTWRGMTEWSGTESPTLKSDERGTATVTVTQIADTEDAAEKRHTLQEDNPEAAHAMRAETQAETGADTRA